jgi:ribosomal protein S18 acetylase RimI-like enzyme
MAGAGSRLQDDAMTAGDSVVMRVELDPGSLRDSIWPAQVSLRSFNVEDAESLHRLLEHGYRRGGGSVERFETWLPEVTGDEEFDPDLCFLVDSGGELAGAALCWTSAFVKDIVVHESWRGQGLGEALLRHVFATFAARGAPAVELKVESTNANAIRLYERVGMRVIERPPLS